MNKHDSGSKLKCQFVLTAATPTVLSRQNPDDVMSGRCQKYSDATHLRDITKTQHSKIKQKTTQAKQNARNATQENKIRNFL
jgi:hypothetical protein